MILFCNNTISRLVSETRALPDEEIMILLGSNQGNSAEWLSFAQNELIKASQKLLFRSHIYRSPPWGFEAEQDFLNQLLVFHQSNWSPLEFLDFLLQMEKKAGRDRNAQSGYQSRNLDADILYFGDRILKHPQLDIPHPRLQLRKFALLPLNEYRADFVHPEFGLSQRELLERCMDEGEVERLEG